MCGGFVEFDKSEFGMVWDTALPGEPRPVELELERGFGSWMVAHVVRQSQASAADVANALFGNPQFAHLVVGTGDRYAFAFPPNKRLAEPYETVWTNRLLIDEEASALDILRYRNISDPVLGLDDELADKRALESATGNVADVHGDVPALQRLEILESMIDEIAAAAAPLGAGSTVQPMQSRIKARHQACAADPGEAQRWASQAAGQLDLLSEAKIGFDAITQQLLAMGLPGQSTATGEELIGDVTKSMQGPTKEVTAAYAAVVAASDQLNIGRERLAIARERMAAYPFDMVDRMLAVIRSRIAASFNYSTFGLHSYERGRLDALQHEISATVAELRMAVVNGDGTATVKLQSLRSQLAMLDLQSSIGAMMSAIHMLKGQLPRSESLEPNLEKEANIVRELNAALEPWNHLATNYDDVWKAGHEQDPEWLALIRKQVEDLRKTTKLPELIDKVSQFAEDEAEQQKWSAIKLMIFAALMSAATGGLASAPLAGVTGVLVGAGIEALTFTAITSTLNQDQTFGGFMLELGLNFVTFAGLSGIGRGAKLLAGARALTLPEKFGVMTLEGLWMTASAKAQEKIQELLNDGGQVTTQSAAKIFGHQMLITFASRLGGYGIGKIITVTKEIRNLKEIERALTLRADVDKLAQKVLEHGDDTVGEALVKADTEALRAEAAAHTRLQQIAAKPGEAARHGITLDEATLEKIQAAGEGAAREVTEREIAALMQHTEVHANHAIAEPVVYAELLKKHRTQGSTVVEVIDSTGQPRATITPSLADHSFGAPFTLHSRLGDEVEKILADKNLPNTAIVSDYMVKRAGNRAGALADLRKVNSVEDLDALMEQTLGKDAVAARKEAVQKAAQQQMEELIYTGPEEFQGTSGDQPLDPAEFGPTRRPTVRELKDVDLSDMTVEAEAGYLEDFPGYLKRTLAAGKLPRLGNVRDYVRFRYGLDSQQLVSAYRPRVGSKGRGMSIESTVAIEAGREAEKTQGILRTSNKNNRSYDLAFFDPVRQKAVQKTVIPDFMPTSQRDAGGRFTNAATPADAVVISDSKYTWDVDSRVALDDQIAAMMVLARNNKKPFVFLLGVGRDVSDNIRAFAQAEGVEIYVVPDVSGLIR